jgi:hypothetical protein
MMTSNRAITQNIIMSANHVRAQSPTPSITAHKHKRISQAIISTCDRIKNDPLSTLLARAAWPPH